MKILLFHKKNPNSQESFEFKKRTIEHYKSGGGKLSIKKQFLKTRPLCKVAFRLSKEESRDAKQIFLVGDFNNWNENKLAMKPLKKGGFVANLDLEPGREYQFRYFFDKLVWGNDPDADNYVHSSFGNCDNSLINL